MPNDLLPPDPAPAPAPMPGPVPEPVRGGASRITCSFCACTLAPSGDVLKMSPEAKAFRDADDSIDSLKVDLQQAAADLAAAHQTIASLERDLAAARAAIPTKKGIF